MKNKKKKKQKTRDKQRRRQQQNLNPLVTTTDPVKPEKNNEPKVESEPENSTYQCPCYPQGNCQSFEPPTINGKNSPCEYWLKNKCSLGALDKNSVFHRLH